jgi:hypothetical protein
MELHTIGIDLGKTVFHMVGCDAQSRRGLYSHGRGTRDFDRQWHGLYRSQEFDLTFF